jgi:hypothetical protein
MPTGPAHAAATFVVICLIVHSGFKNWETIKLKNEQLKREELKVECKIWEKVKIEAQSQTWTSVLSRQAIHSCRTYYLSGDSDVALADLIKNYPEDCFDLESTAAEYDPPLQQMQDLEQVKTKIATLPSGCRTRYQGWTICNVSWQLYYSITTWYGFRLNGVTYTQFLGFSELSNAQPHIHKLCTSVDCALLRQEYAMGLFEILFVNKTDPTQQRYIHQFQHDYDSVLDNNNQCL